MECRSRHPARQNEGPLGHLASPPARTRALWPASWPPRPPERRSKKREHNSHFSPLKKPPIKGGHPSTSPCLHQKTRLSDNRSYFTLCRSRSPKGCQRAFGKSIPSELIKTVAIS